MLTQASLEIAPETAGEKRKRIHRAYTPRARGETPTPPMYARR